LSGFEAEQAHRLLKVAPVLFCTANLSGFFLALSDQWEALVGLPKERLLADPYLDRIHPDDQSRTRHAMKQLEQGLAVQNLENRYRRADDSYVWLSWNAVVHDGEVNAVAVEVTAQRTALEEKRKADRLFGMVEDLAGVGTWRYDIVRDCLHWSPGVFAIHERDPALGEPDLAGGVAYYHPDDRAHVAASVARAVASGEGFEFQARLIREDGQERLVASRGITQQGASGDVVAVLGIFQDLTDSRAMQRQLMDQERLESVAVLASGFAHEINNPLQYVGANVAMAHELLQHVIPRDARWHELTELLSATEHGVEQVAQIVRDLRSFMGRSRAPRGHADLVQVVNAAIRVVRSELRHSALFSESVGPLPRVQGDDATLIQVFVNLLTNAVHAVQGAPAGAARIGVRGWTDARGWAVVEVRDNGPGIAPTDVARVFEPFYTTKPQGQGSGLGLHIARTVLNQVNGTLRVQSEPGRTVFTACIPPAPTTEAGLRAVPMALPVVLVLDDDQRVARTVGRMCGREFTVQIEHDPATALRRIQDDPPDLLICDLMMPAMDGWQFLARARDAWPACARRSVLMTGASPTWARPNDPVDVRILEKPFKPHTLRDTLHELLAQ
jgi:PAS domain S-box-containing protein